MCTVSLVMDGAVNYEIQPAVNLTIRATDSETKLSIATTLTVLITDVNEKPSVSVSIPSRCSLPSKEMFVFPASVFLHGMYTETRILALNINKQTNF